jgi:hypothetical protein
VVRAVWPVRDPSRWEGSNESRGKSSKGGRGRTTEVPDPSNTLYPVPGDSDGSTLSVFNEFAAFPRIAWQADAVATRGNHLPVWLLDATGGPVEIDVDGVVRFGDRTEFTAGSSEPFPAFLYTNSTATFGFDGLYEVFVSSQGNVVVRDRTSVIGALQSNPSVTVGHDASIMHP